MGRFIKSDDRVLFGVCGRIAGNLYVNPWSIRIIWFTIGCICWVGILAYILAAIFMPEE